MFTNTKHEEMYNKKVSVDIKQCVVTTRPELDVINK